MTVSKRRTWIVGTVVAGLLVALAAWFLLISPTLASASELRAQTEQTDQQNQLLELKTAKLKAAYEKLPELQAQLAAAQQQIPTTDALQAFLRELDGLAAAHGVQVASVTPSTPVAFTSAATSSAPATTTGGTPSESPSASPSADAGAGAGTSSATSSTASSSGAPSGLLEMPLSVAVKGSWSDTAAFLADLQSTGPRLMSVDAVQTTPATGDDSAGQQTLSVSGHIFVLPDATAASTPAPASTAAPQLPAMAPGANPLSPNS